MAEFDDVIARIGQTNKTEGFTYDDPTFKLLDEQTSLLGDISRSLYDIANNTDLVLVELTKTNDQDLEELEEAVESGGDVCSCLQNVVEDEKPEQKGMFAGFFDGLLGKILLIGGLVTAGVASIVAAIVANKEEIKNAGNKAKKYWDQYWEDFAEGWDALKEFWGDVLKEGLASISKTLVFLISKITGDSPEIIEQTIKNLWPTLVGQELDSGAERDEQQVQDTRRRQNEQRKKENQEKRARGEKVTKDELFPRDSRTFTPDDFAPPRVHEDLQPETPWWRWYENLLSGTAAGTTIQTASVSNPFANSGIDLPSASPTVIPIPIPTPTGGPGMPQQPQQQTAMVGGTIPDMQGLAPLRDRNPTIIEMEISNLADRETIA